MAKSEPALSPPSFMDDWERDFNASVWRVTNGFYSVPPLSRQKPSKNADPVPGDRNPDNDNKGEN